jgi:hypothetical protein
MRNLDLDALAEQLAEFAPPPRVQATYTPREERIIAGFEDIERFFEAQARLPQHGTDRDIFERLYAVRLDGLRQLEDAKALLAAFDKHGLLTMTDEAAAEAGGGVRDTDALLAALSGHDQETDITQLKFVRSSQDKRVAEDVASRDRCSDFDQFKPIFKQVQDEIAAGTRVTRPFELKAEIRPGALFIVGGQVAYVAEMGEIFTNPQGRTDARLRVIFDNGTESPLLMRSLQRALNNDKTGRRISDPVAGPLFADRADDAETETGTIYVLRSRSDHPLVAEHRDIIHKIGVTSAAVESRIAGAEKQSTYLLAAVDLVATYKVYDVNCQKLEGLIHKVFAAAQIDLTLPDRFGNPVKPREWFLVPIAVIDEAVQRIRDRSILDYRYDPALGRLVKAAD